MQLSKSGLNLKTIRHFIIDECDKVLENVGELQRHCLAVHCVMFHTSVTTC